MTQYILFIHGNTKTAPSDEEWEQFFAVATQSGLFKGGSALGEILVLGDQTPQHSSAHIEGFMRFDGERQKIVELLQQHPVVKHGGTVELCEMPKS